MLASLHEHERCQNKWRHQGIHQKIFKATHYILKSYRGSLLNVSYSLALKKAYKTQNSFSCSQQQSCFNFDHFNSFCRGYFGNKTKYKTSHKYLSFTPTHNVSAVSPPHSWKLLSFIIQKHSWDPQKHFHCNKKTLIWGLEQTCEISFTIFIGHSYSSNFLRLWYETDGCGNVEPWRKYNWQGPFIKPCFTRSRFIGCTAEI